MIVISFLGIVVRSIVHYLAFLIVKIISTVRETARIVRAVRLLIALRFRVSERDDSPNYPGEDPFENLLNYYRSR